MKPELINQRIAEKCGWKYHKYQADVGEGRFEELEVYVDKNGCHYTSIPNYFSDLNACHEMEKTLTDGEWERFDLTLDEIVYRERDPSKNRYRRCSATAPQRCEAFLRTVGGWEEGKDKN